MSCSCVGCCGPPRPSSPRLRSRSPRRAGTAHSGGWASTTPPGCRGARSPMRWCGTSRSSCRRSPAGWRPPESAPPLPWSRCTRTRRHRSRGVSCRGSTARRRSTCRARSAERGPARSPQASPRCTCPRHPSQRIRSAECLSRPGTRRFGRGCARLRCRLPSTHFWMPRGTTPSRQNRTSGRRCGSTATCTLAMSWCGAGAWSR